MGNQNHGQGWYCPRALYVTDARAGERRVVVRVLGKETQKTPPAGN